MIVFDLLNKALGRKTTDELRKDKSRAEFRKNQALLKANPPKPQKLPEFKPTPNDPEYYARNGSAQNEADAQRMVNEYRQKKSPGIKPLY